ncbi:hypothetical protein F53441_9436 [Fusarium austroafricanum]|uniref:Uncharacterized protein n=1 Tax=Fusarium austroafricanum TaxID=2364996 RepID=A0A8H4K962_9HYPO|nr:hypothetical protein F53441_9436 [Fusarium austroafricanum]
MKKPISSVDYFKRVGNTAGNQKKLQRLADIYGEKNIEIVEKDNILHITTGASTHQQVKGIWAGKNLRAIMEEIGLMKDWEYCRGGKPSAA